MDVREALAVIKTRARKYQKGGCANAQSGKFCRCTLCLADWVYEEWVNAHNEVIDLRRKLGD